MLKKVSSELEENFIKSSKGVSSFALKFCCSMNLIAATRAEGGLVEGYLGAAIFEKQHQTFGKSLF